MAYESESEVMHELEEEYSGEGEEEMEGEYAGESSLEGEGWLGAIGNAVGSLLGEAEGEYEDESAFELEAEEEISPIRKIYPDAMMEHLGELAFEAESEEEAAEQFLPLIGMAASKLLPVAAKAIAPLAKKALPKIARAVTKATPRLTQGIGKVAKTLHRNPQTRHLIKTVPAIARRTVGSIARQAAQGRNVTPRTAVRTLARQARHVLAHPGRRRQALRRHHRLERKFHRQYARGMARPHPQFGRRTYGYGAGVSPRAYTPGYAAPGAPTYAASRVSGYAGPGAPPYVAAGAPAYAAGVAHQPGVSAVVHPRYGTCTCAPCPSCGGATVQASGVSAPAAANVVPAAAPNPAYCRACGQVLR